jgi:hypothetical protein
LEVVSAENALDMSTWHKSRDCNEEGGYCGTTHCRAGWIVTLAGKAGKELEAKTSTAFAAMQIYRKSSQIQVSPPRFYEDNKTAMADIEKCARLEKEANDSRN